MPAGINYLISNVVVCRTTVLSVYLKRLQESCLAIYWPQKVIIMNVFAAVVCVALRHLSWKAERFCLE